MRTLWLILVAVLIVCVGTPTLAQEVTDTSWARNGADRSIPFMTVNSDGTELLLVMRNEAGRPDIATALTRALPQETLSRFAAETLGLAALAGDIERTADGSLTWTSRDRVNARINFAAATRLRPLLLETQKSMSPIAITELAWETHVAGATGDLDWKHQCEACPGPGDDICADEGGGCVFGCPWEGDNCAKIVVRPPQGPKGFGGGNFDIPRQRFVELAAD